MLACENNKMKVRQKNDYKSIALPAELQGQISAQSVYNEFLICFNIIQMIK